MTFTIPSTTYQVGTRTLGPFSIGAGITQGSLSVDRSTWTDPNVKLSMRFELSLDNGVTWSPNPSGEATWPYGVFPLLFTAEGGPANPPFDKSMVGPVAIPAGANRRLRAVATVSGGPLTAAVSVDTA